MTVSSQNLLKRFMWKHKWHYTLSIGSIIISEWVMVQFPHLLGQFTDTLSHKGLTTQLVLHYAWLLFLVGVGYVVLYGIGQYRNGQLGRRFEYQLRKRLFAHWETLSTSYFRNRSVGDLLNHAMNDVQTVREALSGGMNILTNAIFLLVATLWMTFTTVSVRLTLVSMIPLFFVPLFIVWLGPRIRNASRRVQEGLSAMADLTEESLAAIRLIKATANEAVEANRFEQRVDEIVNRQMSMFKQSALFQSMIPLMGSLSFGIALWYGGVLVIHKDIQLGAFVAFTLYLAMLITPLQQIGFVINNFQRASASLARLNVLLAETSDIQDPENPVTVSRIRGDIKFRLNEFTYPDGTHPALKRVNFDVLAGETVGIVGRTAAGKTTLANLLPRIFDPPKNSVLIDGVDVRDLPLETLRDAIAYVPQDGFLFSATIRENIGFSSEDAGQEQVVEAAKDACMYEDVMQFKHGFDTLIGERGVALSGGQKQRTAIARAFLKNAPILVMDDSLSAVDMNTEKQLIENMRRIREGKTTLIIAHRLSAVRHADLIVVLDDGRVAELGSHQELLAAGGIYARMHSLQSEGEAATV